MRVEYDPSSPLCTAEGERGHRAWRMEEAPEALAASYARGKPVVVFVHGRGKEPNKGLRGATFSKGLASGSWSSDTAARR